MNPGPPGRLQDDHLTFEPEKSHKIFPMSEISATA